MSVYTKSFTPSAVYRNYNAVSQWRDFLTIDLSKLLEELRDDSTSSIPLEDEYIALALLGNKLRVVSVTQDGTYRFLDQSESLHKILYLAPSEIMALEMAVEELESLMNDPKAKEKDFQDFFERNPDFILNDEYKKAHPHIVLTQDNGERLIPDFVLEPIGQESLSDLLELKLPSAEIFVLQKRRKRFSASVMEACAQLREYSAFFDEERNRRIIQGKYGLLAYKPRMFVVIGRRGKVHPIEIRKMESDLPNMHLYTYDDIITRMKNRIDNFRRGRLRH